MIIKLKHKPKSKPLQALTENPTRTIVGSFALLILTGTLLLMLPFSAKDGNITPLVDAMFTATSATCVTGLVVYDTFTHYTVFGQIIILLLIQLGGLGLVTFTTFFNIALRKKMRLKSMYLAQESISSDSFSDIGHLIKMILTLTFSFELAGALILATVFVPQYGLSGIFISVFLAISSYCNAGFDILGFQGEYASVTNYANNPVVLLTIMTLIICGGLGFIVWQDLYRYRKTKKLMLHSRLVLLMTGGLILFGTLLILISEWNNTRTIGTMNPFQKILNSAFLSVSCRTAGYNSFSIEHTYGITKLFCVILMFIGAAPASTGGGIKVTTIVVLLMTVISVFRNEPETIIHGRRVDKSVVYKSLAVLFTSLLAVFVASGTIYFTVHAGGRNVNEINALFESVSAFATVGLSSGVTAIANTPSLIVLILTMFLGRVGPVSLALSLASKGTKDKTSTVVPEGKILVG